MSEIYIYSPLGVLGDFCSFSNSGLQTFSHVLHFNLVFAAFLLQFGNK